MKLPNGLGCVYKMSRKRRKPYAVLKTVGWEIDEETGRLKQKRAAIGYAKTRLEGMKMLNDFNESPYDIEAGKKRLMRTGARISLKPYPGLISTVIRHRLMPVIHCMSVLSRT